MLSNGPLVAFVATARPEEARRFYAGVLGLQLVHEDQFALEFVVGTASLRVTRVGQLQPAGYTVLGWIVADIQAAVADLVSRGVQFERFPALVQQNPDGVWTAPGGDQVAWFKDPDGNTLSITQPA